MVACSEAVKSQFHSLPPCCSIVLVEHLRSSITVTREILKVMKPGGWLNDEVGWASPFSLTSLRLLVKHSVFCCLLLFRL